MSFSFNLILISFFSAEDLILGGELFFGSFFRDFSGDPKLLAANMFDIKIVSIKHVFSQISKKSFPEKKDVVFKGRIRSITRTLKGQRGIFLLFMFIQITFTNIAQS